MLSMSYINLSLCSAFAKNTKIVLFYVLCGGGGDQAEPVGGEAQRGADATLPLPVHRLNGRGIVKAGQS